MATQYQVSGTLKHDGQVYRDGETFSTEDSLVEKALRRVKAILLPEEYAAEQAASGNAAAQQQLAQQRQALADENARLKAQLAALQGAQSVPGGFEPGQGGESQSAPSAPADSSEGEPPKSGESGEQQ